MVRIIAGWALALILLEPSPAAAQEWRCALIRHVIRRRRWRFA
jgi:hypothetical protein